MFPVSSDSPQSPNSPIDPVPKQGKVQRTQLHNNLFNLTYAETKLLILFIILRYLSAVLQYQLRKETETKTQGNELKKGNVREPKILRDVIVC